MGAKFVMKWRDNARESHFDLKAMLLWPYICNAHIPAHDHVLDHTHSFQRYNAHTISVLLGFQHGHACVGTVDMCTAGIGLGLDRWKRSRCKWRVWHSLTLWCDYLISKQSPLWPFELNCQPQKPIAPQGIEPNVLPTVSKSRPGKYHHNRHHCQFAAQRNPIHM